MAAPWDYASSVYLDLATQLDDGSLVTLSVDRYLNAGLKLKRTLDAAKEKDGLLDAIATELKVKYPPPLQFTIDGLTINRLELQRVFSGKGSPDNIRTAVRLASRYKRTDAKTADKYCNSFIGLDCNGFAGNFWGIDPTTSIDAYDVNRRKAVADVVAGDVMIFYKKGERAAAHIAVVDEVRVADKQFEVTVAQSAGLEVGLDHFNWGKMTPQSNKAGDLFAVKTWPGLGEYTIYFAGGPPKGKPNV